MARHQEIPGEITAYYGPMFSGKTFAMIEHMERAERFAKLDVQVFKPDIDNRGEGNSVIRAKSGREFAALAIDAPEKALLVLQSAVKVVGFDEAQFFNPGIFWVVQELSARGIQVVAAGLNTDFLHLPFGSMPGLMAMANNRVECAGICTFIESPGESPCGGRATRTQKLINGLPASRKSPLIVVGGAELYEARCPRHHQIPD